MKISYFNLWIGCLMAVLLSSCATREQIVYLQGEQENLEQAINYTPTLQSDDQLVITVSAMDPKAVSPFNLINEFPGQDPTRRLTYLIDKNGEIDYPILGKVKLGGLTRIEAVEFLKGKLREYILDPG